MGLKKTGEYITHMQKKIVDHQDEIKSLKSENSQLENQIKALERAKATGNYVNTRSILDSDNIVTGDDIDLYDLNKAEIIYDDTSSDTSDSNSAQGAVNTSGKAVSGSNVMTVSLPKISTVSNVNNIQPGQSLLTANRVQPGQSLLISEPMRKKMKIASNSLM